jgi:ribosomal protein L24
MKFSYKVGDKVQVTVGKHAGKEAAISSIDKKAKRLQLDGLKKQKIKTKKGASKELHGTFHVSSVKAIAAPAAEASAEQK